MHGMTFGDFVEGILTVLVWAIAVRAIIEICQAEDPPIDKDRDGQNPFNRK